MRTRFKGTFIRDLRKIGNGELAARVQQAVEEVERVNTLSELHDLKKMHGTKDFYRIRIGDYRIGVEVEGDVVTFLRCLHRRDIYRYFPP